MAIQQVDLTVPGGDTPRSANTKINANFSNQTHAASRLVGIAKGQIPLAQDTAKAAAIIAADMSFYTSGSADANDFAVGTKYLVSTTAVINCPVGSGSTRFLVETFSVYDPAIAELQIATCYYDIVGRYIRVKKGGWLDWIPISQTPQTYSTTTASGANVVVDAAGKLMRSTSSERYKDILASLVLNDDRYADAMALKPIVYRSTADADNPSYHYYSFSAEELGAYDPAFTFWRETETVTDEDGNVTEQPLSERQAEGININALLAMSHAIAIKQDQLIKDLQAQINVLKPAATT